MYNEETEELEYLQETICVDDTAEVEKASILVDLSDYWDEDSLKQLSDHYYLAEA